MRTTTVRELKHETSKVLSWVEQGESVEVRRRRKPVATLSPPEPTKPAKRPDFLGRLRDAYGEKTLRRSGSSVVSEARGDS